MTNSDNQFPYIHVHVQELVDVSVKKNSIYTSPVNTSRGGGGSGGGGDFTNYIHSFSCHFITDE